MVAFPTEIEQIKSGSTNVDGPTGRTCGIKVPTEWVDSEDWMRARGRKNTHGDMHQFVTTVWDRMKLSIEHGKEKCRTRRRK